MYPKHNILKPLIPSHIEGELKPEMHPRHMTDSELYKNYCLSINKRELSFYDEQVVLEYCVRFDRTGPFLYVTPAIKEIN